MRRERPLAILDIARPVPADHGAAGAVRDGVYRQARRIACAVAPVAAVFLVWDAVAITARVWWYNGKYLIGIELPPRIPIEEVLFFVVIPLCGLLTYNAVTTILDRSKRR